MPRMVGGRGVSFSVSIGLLRVRNGRGRAYSPRSPRIGRSGVIEGGGDGGGELVVPHLAVVEEGPQQGAAPRFGRLVAGLPLGPQRLDLDPGAVDGAEGTRGVGAGAELGGGSLAGVTEAA